eukprot:1668774-Amphidinium_carterae.1
MHRQRSCCQQPASQKVTWSAEKTADLASEMLERHLSSSEDGFLLTPAADNELQCGSLKPPSNQNCKG